ncbi:MAG: DUF4157 domain-containing protein [Planctomycetota bacterium]|nr:DUF4157 domain-containing protein [Planctomycetota bacterium]
METKTTTTTSTSSSVYQNMRAAGVDSKTAERVAGNVQNNSRNSTLLTDDQKTLADLSAVKPHQLSDEQKSNLRASAYSSGSSVNFGPSSSSSPGTQHFAHEATHVVQQRDAKL